MPTLGFTAGILRRVLGFKLRGFVVVLARAAVRAVKFVLVRVKIKLVKLGNGGVAFISVLFGL